jgi:2',3'-cyclic-nucleotide 2'-phosphodiesterase (5'-nucleotidase family)
VKDLRESQKGILVLDSGDLLFKKYMNPIQENELKGMTEKAQLIVESFNLTGYDAIGIGDDDLTLGKEFLLEISKKTNFPFLSSNLLNEASGKVLFQSSLIKEINGLRIGIFSLLSPDLFTGPSDPRKKGLTIRQPIEVAQAMVKELKPKTDLIILLSHLGYVKDIELAQTIQGINIIVGGHTGINLIYPLVIKDTMILQTASRGMFGARLNLFFYNNEPIFYNSATKISLENNLTSINQRLNSKETPEVEKDQWRKAKEDTERTLNQLQGKNEFINNIIPLQDQMKEHPDIKKMLEAYRGKAKTTENPVSPK